MNKLLIVLLFSMISLFSFGREYQFFPTHSLNEAQVDGKNYRIVSVSHITAGNNVELKSVLTNLKRNTNPNKLLLVLDSNGKIIRDVICIQKVFYTQVYSKLTKRDIIRHVSPLILVNQEIDKTLSRVKFQPTSYFSDLNTIDFLIHKTVPLSDEIVENADRSKLLLFISHLLKDPENSLNAILYELLTHSKTRSKAGISQLKAIQGSILSYEEAMEMDKLRLGLVYGSSICDFISELPANHRIKLQLSKSGMTKILKELSDKLSVKTLKRKSTRSLVLLAKDIIQILYAEEKQYQQLVTVINDARAMILRDINQYKSQAKLSARLIPYYKSNYTNYPIPHQIKRAYPKTVFYDHFSGSLIRWDFYGSGKTRKVNSKLQFQGNGWYYTGASSRVLFNPRGGDLHMEILARIGKGKGTYGFGEKLLGVRGSKGVVPMVGFLFNKDFDGSGTVDFRINNEVVENHLRVILDLSKDHRFKLLLYKDNGIEFLINNKRMFSHLFKSESFESESVVFSSMSDDYSWKEVRVHQIASK